VGNTSGGLFNLYSAHPPVPFDRAESDGKTSLPHLEPAWPTYLVCFVFRQRLVRRRTVLLLTLSARAMSLSPNPLSNRVRTRRSNPGPNPVARPPRFLSHSSRINGGSSRRGPEWAKAKNRDFRASFLALIRRSAVHPEDLCDAADVSPRVQGSPNLLL
jgi:hypothetical protein